MIFQRFEIGVNVSLASATVESSLCEAFSVTRGVGSAHRRWNAKRVKLCDRFLLVGTVNPRQCFGSWPESFVRGRRQCPPTQKRRGIETTICRAHNDAQPQKDDLAQ